MLSFDHGGLGGERGRRRSAGRPGVGHPLSVMPKRQQPKPAANTPPAKILGVVRSPGSRSGTPAKFPEAIKSNK